MPSRTPVQEELSRVHEALGPLRSMAPDRDHATPLLLVAQRALDSVRDDRLVEALCRGLARLARASADHFPGNIFGDLDYLAAAAVKGAERGAGDPVAHLDRTFDLMARLYHLFGNGTAINFRYVHDFIYGFDWAKWVRKDPHVRAAVGPFDIEFLEYLWGRGHELLELISRNDRKYPTLPNGTKRNPFGFSREPEDERRLHESLARAGSIPVPAWDPNARPRWDADFYALRDREARRLAIAP